MARSALDDLREDARAFARQHPGLVHSMVFLPGDGEDLCSMFSYVFGEDLLQAARLGLPSQVKWPFETSGPPVCLGKKGASTWDPPGIATMLLWGEPSEQDSTMGRWQDLLDRAERLAGERVRWPPQRDETRTWPLLFRFAWTTPGPVGFERSFAWCGRIGGGLDTRVLVRLPKEHFDPGVAHVPDREHVIQQLPVRLAGEWVSTIYPAGDALVALIDDLLVGGGAEVSNAGAGAAVGVPIRKPEGWTQNRLMEVGEISAGTFRAIREEAGIKRSEPGAKGAHRRYTPDELRRMIGAAPVAAPQLGANAASKWRELLPAE